MKTAAIKKKPAVTVLGGLATLLAAGGMAAWNEYVRRHRTVTVINGLTQPVTVAAGHGGHGGQAVTVAPGTMGTLTVKEGRHHAAVTGAVTENIDFTVESGYLDRWTKSPAFVLIPGGETPLEFVRGVYSKDNPRKESIWTLGRNFVHYEDVDHLFEPLPDTVMGERTLTSLNRTLEVPATVVAKMGESQGTAAAMDAAELLLTRHPADEDLLEAYTVLVRDEATERRAMDFLAKGLNRRPLSMPMAITWQNLHWTPEAKKELRVVCDQLAAAAPDNADLLYLKGRTMPDGAESAAVFEKAKGLAPENPWPLFALGYLLMEQGKWSDSRALLTKAAALAPDQKRIATLLAEARLGCGEGAALARELTSGTTVDSSVLRLRLRALAAAGDTVQGAETMRSLTDLLISHKTDPVRIHTETNQWLYMSRQFTALAQLNSTAQTAPAQEGRVWLALQNGDLAAAEKNIAESKLNPVSPMTLDTPIVRMALWVASGMAGDEPRHAAARTAVINDLEHLSDSGRRAAALIGQQSEVTQEQLDGVYLYPLMKGLFCAGLIHSHPAQKEFLASQAAVYNADRRFPSALVDQAIGKPVTTP